MVRLPQNVLRPIFAIQRGILRHGHKHIVDQARFNVRRVRGCHFQVPGSFAELLARPVRFFVEAVFALGQAAREARR